MIEFELADALSNLLKTALVVVTGAGGVWLSTELVKRAKNLPMISEHTKAALVGTAGVLSALATLVLGAVNQNLTPETIQDVIVKLLEFAGIWLGAHTVHKALKKEESPDS